MKKLYYYKGANPYPKSKKGSAKSPSLLRPIIILTVFFAFLGFAVYGVLQTVPKVKNSIATARSLAVAAPPAAITGPELPKIQAEISRDKGWKFAELKTDCPDVKTLAYLTPLLSTEEEYTDYKISSLREKVLKEFPYLKTLELKKGKVSDKLWLTCSTRKAVASVKQGDSVMLIDETGALYPGWDGEDTSVLLSIENEGPKAGSFDKNFVDLINAYTAIKKDLAFVRVITNADKSRVIMADGSAIIFNDSANIKEKTKTVLKILKYRKEKTPFNLDLTYYNAKKAYLTEVTNGKK